MWDNTLPLMIYLFRANNGISNGQRDGVKLYIPLARSSAQKKMDIRCNRCAGLLNDSVENCCLCYLDIDEKNLQYARQNVQRNNLQSRIQVVDSVPDGPLIPLDRIQLKM